MSADLDFKKKAIVKYLLGQRVLVKPEILHALNQPEHVELLYQQVQNNMPAQALLQHAAVADVSTGTGQLQTLAPPTSYLSRVKVVFRYQDKPKTRTPQDFVNYFNARYKALAGLLQQRQELQNLTSIARLTNKRDRETVSVIGMVADKQVTKNENIMLTLEDTSGQIRVMVSKSKPDVWEFANDVVLDEVIGVVGSSGSNILFANSLILPDIPLTGELKKSPDEVYAAVLSCIHVGSKLFLRESFERFIRWLRGETGNDQQREIAKKVGYVFIAGDLVDGIGIYPNQEKELELQDIYEQYEEIARLLCQIPQHIALIIVPGNHDAGRISEPQPAHSTLYAKPLYSLPNALLLTNPCIVNIHHSETFPGFDVLVYHGYSFDDYGEIVPSIKNSGKNISDRTPLIMRFLLRRRHLAPTHSSTLYIPDPEKDPLVLERVPDLFVGGHIHKSNSSSYRGVTIVSGSCFQAKTPFQEKMGHEPDPGHVPIINLQTRVVKTLRF
jgi:DNA polymerase II small subunit